MAAVQNKHKYKTLRRLCMIPFKEDEPKMHTLYECSAKVGTTSTTRIWFMDIPEKGKEMFGIDENTHYSPYMNGHAFRYAEFKWYVIDDVYEDGYVICHCF